MGNGGVNQIALLLLRLLGQDVAVVVAWRLTTLPEPVRTNLFFALSLSTFGIFFIIYGLKAAA